MILNNNAKKIEFDFQRFDNGPFLWFKKKLVKLELKYECLNYFNKVYPFPIKRSPQKEFSRAKNFIN